MRCTLCGEVVDTRGLRRHQANRACQARQNENAMRERGWQRVGEAYRALKDAGFAMRRELGINKDGGLKVRAVRVWWAPTWAVEATKIAELEYLKQILEQGEDECRRAVALHRLGGKQMRRLSITG